MHFLEALRSAERKGRYVFPGRDPSRPIGSIKKAFATAVHKAGLKGLTPHSLRKAYATRYALLGTPSRLLQANLGHAAGSRVTDQYYVFATEEARRQTIRPLPMPVQATSGLAKSGNNKGVAATPGSGG
jgi:integrase